MEETKRPTKTSLSQTESDSLAPTTAAPIPRPSERTQTHMAHHPVVLAAVMATPRACEGVGSPDPASEAAPHADAQESTSLRPSVFHRHEGGVVVARYGGWICGRGLAGGGDVGVGVGADMVGGVGGVGWGGGGLGWDGRESGWGENARAKFGTSFPSFNLESTIKFINQTIDHCRFDSHHSSHRFYAWIEHGC